MSETELRAEVVLAGDDPPIGLATLPAELLVEEEASLTDDEELLEEEELLTEEEDLLEEEFELLVEEEPDLLVAEEPAFLVEEELLDEDLVWEEALLPLVVEERLSCEYESTGVASMASATADAIAMFRMFFMMIRFKVV